MSARIRIGVSSCLLGQAVRYDGGHKYNAGIAESLGRRFDLVPYCPEMAIGLGVPRRPIHLMQGTRGVCAGRIGEVAFDVTAPLAAYAGSVAAERRDVSGYIFKAGSPSCGMQGVPVFAAGGAPLSTSAGIYAARLMQLLPELPCEDEARLMDPAVLANFIARVLAYHGTRQGEAG